MNFIANFLTKEGIPTPRGKQKWQPSTVESILTNEKYKGSAILQKKFTVDFLNKKMKINEGEVPQYYVENSHPAIIDPEEWETVQKEMALRKSGGNHRNSLSPFSSKIICGDCGEFFGSKVWHSTDKYRRVIWQCNNKFKNEKRCTTAHLNEESIKELFIKALGRLTENRGELINTCELLTAELSDTAAIDAKIKEHQAEMELTAELIKRLIAENANSPLNQVNFNREYDGLVERFTKATEKCEKLQRQKLRRLHQSDITSSFATEIKALPKLNIQYSDRLWLNLIDTATVYGDEKIVFRFKNGTEIEEVF